MLIVGMFRKGQAQRNDSVVLKSETEVRFKD